jgi:hypothetical protein
MFHALALSTDPNSAKSMAFTFPRMADGIRRGEGKSVLLTAVVEDDLDRSNEAVSFSLGTLEEQNIRIAHLGEMNKVAQQDASELGL